MRKSYLSLIVLIASFLGFLFLPSNGSGTTEIIFSLGLQIIILLLSIRQIWYEKRLQQFSWAWQTALFSLISSGLLVGVYSSTTELSTAIPIFNQTLLSGLILLSVLTLFGFTNKGTASLASTNKLLRWQVIYGIGVGAIYLAVTFQNNKVISWFDLKPVLICTSTSGLMLWYFALYKIEKSLINKLPHDEFNLFINGKTSIITDDTVLATLQSVKTVAFAKRNLLTDGKVIFQEVNHRATMLENTVLSTFYALFIEFDPKIAELINERLGEARIEIKFESTEIHEDSISATDEFGVKYTLGNFTIAKEFTQDDSYTYYLTRGYTLFAKLLFSDSVIALQRPCIDEFNFKPMNTVCISEENHAACGAVVQELALDKAYSQLNTEEQANLLKQLNDKAPTAYIGFLQELCESSTVGFQISKGDAVKQLKQIWSFFHLARLIRNTFRGLNYWLFTSVIICTPLLLIYKIDLVWVVLCTAITNVLISLLFWVILTIKYKN